MRELEKFDEFNNAVYGNCYILDKTKDYYWFILLPEETATTPQKPICFNFQAKVRLGMAALSVDEMLQETITLYKSTEVNETKGLPEAG